MGTKLSELMFELETSEFTNECTTFSGTRDRGYGRLRRDGKMVSVSRVVLEYKLGRQLEKNECACHTCDNPGCYNPNHLFVGSHQENMTDKATKGRASRLKKESNPHSKLTDDQVDEIRGMLACGYSQTYIASVFKISQPHVSSIKRNKVWA